MVNILNQNRLKKLLGRTVLLIMGILLAGWLSGCGTKTSAKLMNVTPEDAKQWLKDREGIVLLDVRTPQEYALQHIPGSVLLPLDELEAKAAEVLPDHDATILVYCRSGNRSTTAGKILIAKGYTQVYNLGGIINWPYETQP